MKFGMGLPAWLGALLIVAPPGAITGFVMGQYEAILPAWALIPAGFLLFILSSIACLALYYALKTGATKRKKDDAKQAGQY